jgi:hypothetical protein
MKERKSYTQATMVRKALEMSRYWAEEAKRDIAADKRWAAQNEAFDIACYYNDSVYRNARNAASRANDAVRFVSKWIDEA